MNLNQLSILDNAVSRSISPESFGGEKGRAGMATTGTGESCARELGQGWKVSPFVRIAAGQTFQLADFTPLKQRAECSRISIP